MFTVKVLPFLNFNWPLSIKYLQSPQLPLLHFVTVKNCCLGNRALHNILFLDLAFAVYFLKFSLSS